MTTITTMTLDELGAEADRSRPEHRDDRLATQAVGLHRQLPGGEQQYPVAREHECLHRGREEGHSGVEARLVSLFSHVADRVE